MKKPSLRGEWFSERTPLLLECAEALRADFHAADVGVMLLGSMAVLYLCENPEETFRGHTMCFGDIDLIGKRKDVQTISEVICRCGFAEDMGVRLKFGNERRAFLGGKHDIRIDLFLDEIRMNHTFRPLWDESHQTFVVTPADFLLEKLQIVDIKTKDFLLMLAVVGSNPIVNSPSWSGIDVSRLGHILGNDWGFWITSRLNILKADDFLDRSGFSRNLIETCRARLAAIDSSIVSYPKSLRWHLRRLLGKRLRWYQEVDPW